MIPLYILAGGESSRFGSDKARAELGGHPLIVRVADGLRPACSSVTAVAREADLYIDLDIDTIGDDEPGQGPMGGLVTALRHAGGPLFLASCDLREPRADWAQQVIGAGTTAAVKTNRGWEPLFARYDPTVLPIAERLLSEGERSLQVLLGEVEALALDAPDDWPDPSSFNTPDDLK